MKHPESGPLELRCSALPLAFICPGSVRREGLVIDESGADAQLGTAAHEGLATMAETGAVPWPKVGELARRHRVPEQELKMLLALGQKLWPQVRALFPRPSTERELIYRDPSGAFVLTGHTDVLSMLGRLVRIADWKTGRRDADYSEQLRGYCVLALDAGGAGVSEAEAFALWVRESEVERYRMTAAEARKWLARLRAEVVEWNGRYRVGTHCEHCPRHHECPAGLALVRSDVAAVADAELAERLGDDALASLAPDELVTLLARADLAADIAARVRAAIRGYVQRRGEVVGAGRRLTLQTEERRELDVLRAFPVLVAAGLDDDDMAEVIEMSIAAAERIVARKAQRGKGAAAKRALTEALEAAGAIKTNVKTKLITRRE